MLCYVCYITRYVYVMLCCITCHVMLYNIIFMLYNMLCFVIFMLCYICYITCNVRLRYITCYVVLCLSYVIEHVLFMSCYITCYIYVI